jgi:(p)ppGpp synthase/HD superfamily hydrolase
MERTTARDRTEDGAAPDFVGGSDLVERAYEFARRAHATQRRRGDGSPFIGHPVTVARMLHESRLEEELIAAALLHDVVENTEVSAREVEERFGAEVARLVEALSEDPAISDYAMRKSALRDQVADSGQAAAAIFAADKLSNLCDMRAAYDRDSERSRDRFPVSPEVRLALWRGDLEMVERVAPNLPFLRRFRYELEAFEEANARAARASG